MAAELKSCPFCGNKETVFSEVLNDSNDWSKVECPECEARIYGNNLLDAIRKWNRRPDTKEKTGTIPQHGQPKVPAGFVKCGQCGGKGRGNFNECMCCDGRGYVRA